MKKLLILIILSGLSIALFFGYQNYQYQRLQIERARAAKQQEEAQAAAFTKRLHDKAAQALTFAKAHDFDQGHAILIDFSLPSGKNRFFVWSYAENKVVLSSLVAHGYGNDAYRSSASEVIFSNIPGSFASSLGKYRIGARAYSQYGINIHYKLHGLEATNSNAYERIIVLHSYKDIPKTPLYPLTLPLGYSQGCPVIDDQTMRLVDQLLQPKKKSVLLWVYD